MARTAQEVSMSAPLTEKQVIIASGPYPQTSDEDLLAWHKRQLAAVGKSVRGFFISAAIAFLSFVVGVICDPTFTGVIGPTAALLALLATGYICYSFLLIAGEAAQLGHLERELRRRGVPIPS
jgi:hypothetical protein